MRSALSSEYAIIGSGKIDTALTRAFARDKIEVAIATARGPKRLASLAKELVPSVNPQSVQDAYEVEDLYFVRRLR